MKKIVYFMTAFCLIFLAGCTSTTTPKETVKTYLENLKTGKYLESIQLLMLETEETPTQEELNELAQKFEDSIDEQNGIAEYEILSEVYNTDNTQANVIARVRYGDETEENMTFSLYKVDNKWLISLMDK
ncbi:DUF4878 domain-containing protein [Paludibacteraceae bacterium OttesenSCG-928-F17]|nr:DUF4878 domain-containing protein [Paludibacteraceae bacterium OttesenSCG-928-F17]